jgi:rSAM/selenodomain-associated transferase 2
MARISIIIPALDDAEAIGRTLLSLAPLRARGFEVIVGGSSDATMASPAADRIIAAPRSRAAEWSESDTRVRRGPQECSRRPLASLASASRAAQLNAGAAAASGDVLLFLHADTTLPPDADAMITEGLRDATWQWGRFDVRIEGRSRWLPVVAFMMNWRSLATGIATGDQAIFVRREAFAAVGGFPDLPLMEDIALSKRLKRLSRPLCLAAKATISGRRWDRDGALRTILRTWWLRLAYFFGAKPAALARRIGIAPQNG